VLVQGLFLVSRTLLTDAISRVEGACGRAITSLVRCDDGALEGSGGQWLQRHRRPRAHLRLRALPATMPPARPPARAPTPRPPPPLLQQFDRFGSALVAFAAVGVPAAVVNAALKYMQARRSWGGGGWKGACGFWRATGVSCRVLGL
jgi:hypothetical protein